MRLHRSLSVVVLGLPLIGCSSGGSSGSTPVPGVDGGSPTVDAGHATPESGAAPDSSGGKPSDSGVVPPIDAGGAPHASAALPLITPSVRAAAPKGFFGTGGASLPSGVHGGVRPIIVPGDVRDRFFGAGPTDIYQILQAIDDRVTGINLQIASGGHGCVNDPAVAYTLTPVGESVPFYAQCYQQLTPSAPGDPGLVQFGQSGGLTYYFMAVGAGWIAAVLTPVASAAGDGGADAGQLAGDAADDAALADGSVDGGAPGPAYEVHAWAGVGYLNATSCGSMNGFDDCSYGVIELQANPSQGTFEMAVAGIGFGYCGAQLKSDGAVLYATGSSDMGTVCAATDSICVSAVDLTTVETCGASLTTFALPSLGRGSSVGPNAGGPGNDAAGASWAASAYPGGASDAVVLDGTSTDSLHFGPTTPTPGLNAF